MVLLLTLLLTAAVGGWAGAQPSDRSSDDLQLGCRDHNNQLVDWYVLYKLPKPKSQKSKEEFAGLSEEEKDFVREGSAYLHISSASTKGPWSLSKVPIWDSNSHPGRTLEPVYNYGRRCLFYRFYNDHWPVDVNAHWDKGHTKGVLAYDGNYGFWMIHSVPKFPPAPKDGTGYSYASNGLRFGQSFLCISLKYLSEFNKIIKQLQINEAFCYAWKDHDDDDDYVSLTVPREGPCRLDRYGGRLHQKEDWAIQFIRGDMRIFAKSSSYHVDLYSDLVAPNLTTSLYAETWRANLSSSCSGLYHVEDVRNVTVTTATGKFGFPSTNDHSKWAVSKDRTKPWVCIGDLNRAVSQMRRGGGTVCFRNYNLRDNFHDAVYVPNSERCPYHEMSIDNPELRL
ncbi:deoxyribonuclease-2-beta-like [Amphibalanus amphitrite]|uniref:deoxyribonuclease-2-beta-like n=1 Tax=Amphibalanus amphitrite TaxID=1232801 RepID=UPI001C907106|nr:deoxyribonuclease-2-beta-like [Amphibalanus amphitrite]